MKRSSNLHLTLMAAAIPVALVGCDSEPTGRVMPSVYDCDYQSDVDPAQCRASYEQALAQHEKSAPRFEDAKDCNDQFGSCQPITNEYGQASWIPPMGGFLLGYMVGQAIDGSRNRGADCNLYPDQPGCRGGVGAGGYRVISGSSPLYRDYRSGEYLKPNGDYAANRGGQVFGKAGTPTVPARAITVSRSGFGSSSAARSSFGSGRGFGG